MKKLLVLFAAVSMGTVLHAQKLATIEVQGALVSTKEGQDAFKKLEAAVNTKKADLEKRQNEITSIQNQIRAGSATMSEEAKTRLQRDFDAKTTNLKRIQEDYQADAEQEQGRLVNELGKKLMAVLDKYVQQNKITLVIDVSNPQSPVYWADPSIDITAAIVKLYDEANPVTAAPAAAPAKPPAPATKK
jgi:outer membrane protein